MSELKVVCFAPVCRLCDRFHESGVPTGVGVVVVHDLCTREVDHETHETTQVPVLSRAF